MNTPSTSNIAVIIIFFNPSKEDIASAAIVSKRYNTVIYDNSPSRTPVTPELAEATYIWDGTNIGIAAAQNRAIEAIPGSYEYVVFLDQDSRTAND